MRGRAQNIGSKENIKAAMAGEDDVRGHLRSVPTCEVSNYRHSRSASSYQVPADSVLGELETTGKKGLFWFRRGEHLNIVCWDWNDHNEAHVVMCNAKFPLDERRERQPKDPKKKAEPEELGAGEVGQILVVQGEELRRWIELDGGGSVLIGVRWRWRRSSSIDAIMNSRNARCSADIRGGVSGMRRRVFLTTRRHAPASATNALSGLRCPVLISRLRLLRPDTAGCGGLRCAFACDGSRRCNHPTCSLVCLILQRFPPCLVILRPDTTTTQIKLLLHTLSLALRFLHLSEG